MTPPLEQLVLFSSVADPGFTRRAQIPKVGVKNYYSANFSQKKLHENKRNWTEMASPWIRQCSYLIFGSFGTTEVLPSNLSITASHPQSILLHSPQFYSDQKKNEKRQKQWIYSWAPLLKKDKLQFKNMVLFAVENLCNKKM